MYLNSINAFRAVAIITIVAGHCCLMGRTCEPVTLYGKVIENLVQGGSHFFMFISGFMFFHVYYARFQYAGFLIGKAKRILLPYMLMSVVPVLYYTFHKHALVTRFGLPDDYVWSILYRLATGNSFVPYWYIPVILVIFLLSPFFLLYLRCGNRIQIGLLVVLYVLALLVHRSVDNLNVFQSVVYFLPVYMLGMVCSQHSSRIYRALDGRQYWVLLGALGLAVYQALFLPTGNFEKAFFRYGGLDIMLLQKTMLCLFFLLWFSKHELKEMKWLHDIGRVSFPIYFLHPYVFSLFKKIGLIALIPQPRGIPDDLIVLLLMTAAVPLISVQLASLIKKCMNGSSKLLIGW